MARSMQVSFDKKALATALALVKRRKGNPKAHTYPVPMTVEPMRDGKPDGDTIGGLVNATLSDDGKRLVFELSEPTE